MLLLSLFFFFNDTATTEIYTLSLHDALPIWLPARLERGPLTRVRSWVACHRGLPAPLERGPQPSMTGQDRKSTRLNSSHANISYAVFCLKKKKKETESIHTI